jgi:cation transport regulator ChaC
MAYRVAGERLGEVLARLNQREKGGYDRVPVELHLAPDAARGPQVEGGIMYVATPENPNYLGPAPLETIARQVLDSEGPSGHNLEYVRRLAEALRALCPSLDERNEEALALASLLERVAPQLGGEALESGPGRRGAT